MRIALIRPPRPFDRAFLSIQTPINLAALAAYLIREGHECRIWDFEVESRDLLGEKIAAFQPDFAGITCMTHSVVEGARIAERIKGLDPSIRIVTGGPHPSALPERTLKEFEAFDIAVVGEGEIPLADLAGGKDLEEIPGVVYRKEGEIEKGPDPHLIEDLDSLPFPNRSLFSTGGKGYRHPTRGISFSARKITQVFTSRGCSFKCIFCAIHPTLTHRVRYRSVDNVMAEIEECIKEWGIEHFIFQDDIFTLMRERTLKICRALKKLGISWSCDGRVDTVDLEMLEEMKNAGCRKITFGVEAGSPRIQELNRKGITSEQVRDAFRWARTAGIELIEGSFMLCSHPSETEEEIRMTMDLAREVEPDIFFLSVAVPYPGTELYRIMTEKGYIHELNWPSFTMYAEKPCWKTEHFSSMDLVRSQRKYLNIYYFRPRYILNRIKKTRNMKDLAYWIAQGMRYLWNP